MHVDSPCADPLVRQAIARAMDRTAVVTDILAGCGDATSLPVPVGHADWCEEAACKLAYDPNEAEDLLVQAGYRRNEEDGLRYQGRTALAVTMIVNSENERKTAGFPPGN